MNSWSDFADLLETDSKDKLVFEKSKQACPDCKGSIVRHGGNMVCLECGQVIDSVLDVNDEYRNAASIRDTERCTEGRQSIAGEEPCLQTIGFAGLSIGSKVQKTATWSMASSQQRMLQDIQVRFVGLCHCVDLPDVVAKTMTEIYQQTYTKMKSHKHMIKRNNVKDCLVAGCFFFACIEHECPRDMKEVAKIVGVTPKIVSTGRNIVINLSEDKYAKIPPIRPSQFLARFATSLHLPWVMNSRVRQIIDLVEEHHVMHESSPISLCAGVIYMISKQSELYLTKIGAMEDKPNLKILTRMIAQACPVSEAVIVKIAKQLVKDDRLSSLVIWNDEI
jgi:transcription initiation factor TFIIB